MNKSCTLKSYKSKCLEGIIFAPSDKSISHRALILASICIGNSKIFGLLESEDILNTLKSIKKLGIKITKKKNYYEVFGNGGSFSDPVERLDFGNSGTGIRLTMGLLATRNINATLVGDSSLSSRPMLRVINPLKEMNTIIEHNKGCLPVKINSNNFFSIPIKHKLSIGSAQVKSAILLAATSVQGSTEIIEEIPSRDHTERLLKYLGANISIKKKSGKNNIKLISPTILPSKDFYIPGDFSSAAFFIVAALLIKDSKITIKNVGLNFFRIGLLEALRKMNGKIIIKNKRYINMELVGDIEIFHSRLNGIKLGKVFSARLIDEYPILFVAASFAKGTSKFYGLEELKFKESNRIESMEIALKDAGVKITSESNWVEITGKKNQVGGNFVSTNNDHRIAMSMLVFGMVSEKPVSIDNFETIKTSFPNFKELFSKVGAKIEFFQK